MPLLIIAKVQLLFYNVPAEVGKSFLQVKNLVTAQTQLRLYSEQQRVFGSSNICYCPKPMYMHHASHWSLFKKDHDSGPHV